MVTPSVASRGIAREFITPVQVSKALQFHIPRYPTNLFKGFADNYLLMSLAYGSSPARHHLVSCSYEILIAVEFNRSTDYIKNCLHMIGIYWF